MSFSIDNAKIEELLQSPGVGHDVFPFSKSIVSMEDDTPFYPTNMAGGVTFSYSEPVSSHVRTNLLNLRAEIEASGIRLTSSEELDAEIRGIRR